MADDLPGALAFNLFNSSREQADDFSLVVLVIEQRTLPRGA